MIVKAFILKNREQLMRDRQQVKDPKILDLIVPQYEIVDMIMDVNKIEFANMSIDGKNIDICYSCKHGEKMFKVKYDEIIWKYIINIFAK